MKEYKLTFTYCYTHDYETYFEANNRNEAKEKATVIINEHSDVTLPKLVETGEIIDL